MVKLVSSLAPIAVAALAGLVVLVSSASVAGAHTVRGYDVSWPQCDEPLPKNPGFGIVGVNGGKPYTRNPCLSAQYRWARTGANPPAFYLNTSNPGTASTAVNWYGQRKPLKGCSADNEAACAYNFGYNGAAHAFAYAQKQTRAAMKHSWWLDVETTNTWSDDVDLNVASIMGSLAYLRSRGVPVAIYSTGFQWRVITGGLQLAGVPAWLAGASNADQAARWCTTARSFTGGRVLLVQWVQDGLDHNHLCAPLPTSSGGNLWAALDLLLSELLSGLQGKT